jgi:anti-sigma B factor antagonist
MANLTIQRRQNGQVVILDLAGRLQLGEAGASMRETIRELLAAGEKQIIINMADVTHMDSSGLGDLVSSFASAKTKGSTVKLMKLPQRIDNLLQMTKLLTVFEVYEDEEEAVASFGEAQSASDGSA